MNDWEKACKCIKSLVALRGGIKITTGKKGGYVLRVDGESEPFEFGSFLDAAISAGEKLLKPLADKEREKRKEIAAAAQAPFVPSADEPAPGHCTQCGQVTTFGLEANPLRALRRLCAECFARHLKG